MIKILIKFWPALIPLALFAIWYFFLRRKNTEYIECKEKQQVRESRIWLVTLVSTILLLILSLGYILYSQGAEKGEYFPSYIEDGKIVPARVVPNNGSTR